MAGVFYAMLPDINGHERLEGNLAEVDGKDADDKPTKQLKLAKSWDDVRQRFVDFYRPTVGKEAPPSGDSLHQGLDAEAKKVYERHLHGLNEFVKENGDKIKAHFESLTRFEEGRKTDPRTMFQKQRRWDEMQDLRKEAKGWISDLDSRESALKGELLDLLRKDRKSEVEAVKLADKEAAAKADAKKPVVAEAKKPAEKAKAAVGAADVVDFSSLAENHAATGPFAASANPLSWKRTEQLAFLLTWSLFGIGLCLMLGLFTRPAALAGAGFMLFVVMSQPSFPGVYPLDPPQLGHALLVNKDFVEMIALLVIASTVLGRWTGLDFFLHNFLIKPFCCRFCNCSTTEGRKA